jgi:hypothetical protein
VWSAGIGKFGKELLRIDKIRRETFVFNIGPATKKGRHWAQMRLYVVHGETYASSKLLIAFLMPSTPAARDPAGKRLDPDIVLSSEIRSDSSLKETSLKVSEMNISGRDAPEKREYSRHTTYGQNLVANCLSTMIGVFTPGRHCDCARSAAGWCFDEDVLFFLVELFLAAHVEYGNQHVGNYEPENT